MNGVGGGGTYMSEDDEDYKPSSSHLQSSAAYYNSHLVPNPLSSSGGGNPTSATGGQVGLGGGGNSTNTSSITTTTGGGGGSQGSSSRNQVCCLIDDGKRCTRFAGNASYSKRIQKTVYYKRLKLEIDLLANHIYICDYHKMVIQNARTRQKRDSEDELNDGDDVPEVDLYQLQVNTLRRYKKHFKIPSRPGLNKAQLADILMRHFKTIPVMEKETVTYFIYMIKSEKNKAENNNRPDGGGAGGNTEYTERY